MKKIFLFVFLFVFCFEIVFAETEISYGNVFETKTEEVHIGSTIFTLPNKYIVFRSDNNSASCGNRGTGEYITFATRPMSNVDLNSNAAIVATKNVAKKNNSTILKIERFDLNGKIIITTHEKDSKGEEEVKAYYFRQGNMFLISFTQFPRYGDLGYIENYEQSRNLLLFIINSAR